MSSLKEVNGKIYGYDPANGGTLYDLNTLKRVNLKESKQEEVKVEIPKVEIVEEADENVIDEDKAPKNEKKEK